MRLVPGETSISLPSMVSLGMGLVGQEGLELGAKLLDVRDVGADGPVVEGADRGTAAAPGHVQDGVDVLLAPVPLDDAVDDLVDPPGGLPAGRALAAALVGVEAGH